MAGTKMTTWATVQARAWCAVTLVVMGLGVTSDAAAQTGTVNGRVTNAATGAGVNAVPVLFCLGTTCSLHATNVSGDYTATLPVGTYTAYSAAPATLVDEVFDNISCPMPAGCGTLTANELGTRIVVAAGSVTSGVNFALDPVGTVTGRVTDAATGAPLAGVEVDLRTRFGRGVATAVATSNASGVFTFSGLGPGTYTVFTNGRTPAKTHADIIFGGLLCLASCSENTALDSGTPVVVTPGVTTGGIDFALPPGGTIAGRVVNSATGAALSGVTVRATTRAGVGLKFAGAASVDGTGVYSISGLPPGAYQVEADSRLGGAIPEVHDNQPCRATCTASEVGRGTPVTVSAGATNTVDFRLDPGGSISGTLTNAATQLGVRGTVQVFRLEGTSVRLAAAATSTAAGTFVVSGLNTGVHVALAQITGFAPALFNGVRCEPCSTAQLLGGTPIGVTNGANTPGINIALSPTGSISGTVRAAGTNAPIANAEVLLFRNGPTPFASAFTNTAGGYTVGGLLPGGAVVATDAGRFANQFYPGVVCPGNRCAGSPAQLQAGKISVAAGANITGIDFILGPATGPPGAPQNLRAVQGPAGMHFAWDAPADLGPATSYVLEAGLSPGSTFAAVPVAGTTFSVPGVPPGTFFLRVRALNGAGGGPASAELRLRVGAGGVILPEPPSNFETSVVGGRLTMTWSPAETGVRPTSYLVEVGSASGLANIAVLPVATAAFTFPGVPPGFFYFRVRAQNAGGTSEPGEEQMLVAGNGPAPPSVIPTVTSTVAGNVLTLTWQAPAFGPVASYRVEAGSAPGLANLGVFDTGTTATSLVVPGVPRGTYYVRLRAVNTLGASTVSDERVIVVP